MVRVASTQDLIRWAASQYGVNPQLALSIARRESSFDTDVMNDWDINARNGTPSGGLFQFIEPTFNSFARQAREANPAAWRGVPMDWMNPRAQALAASWAFANGQGRHWATWDAAREDAGEVRGPRGNSPAPSATPSRNPTLTMPRRPRPSLTGIQRVLERSGQAELGKIIDNSRTRMRDRLQDQQEASAAPDPVSAPVSGGGNQGTVQMGAGVLKRRKGEPAWRYLQRIGRDLFGLENDPGDSQTTGGRHTEGSHHYRGTAIDFGDARNTEQQLQAWHRWVNQNREPLGVVELLDEGDHIHAALARALRKGNKNGTTIGNPRPPATYPRVPGPPGPPPY